MNSYEDYDTLNALIDKGSEVIQDLEILPYQPDGESFALVERHLGLPQELLVSLFCYARERFFSSKDLSNEAIEHATRWILMTVPDHNTALNARKRLLVAQGKWDQERYILNLLYCIPRNAKSSILWHHRYWVLNHLYGESWRPAIIRAELETITKACKLYPKNYYAWQYRHLVAKKLDNLLIDDENVRLEDKFVDNISSTAPADATALTYVQFYLGRRLSSEPANHSLDFIESLRLFREHEALWYHARWLCRWLDSDTDLSSTQKQEILASIFDPSRPPNRHSLASKLWIIRFTKLSYEESNRTLQDLRKIAADDNIGKVFKDI